MHYAVIYFILFFLRGQGYGLDFKALDPGSRGGAPLRYASPHPKTTRAHNLFGLGFLMETLVRRDGETQDRTDAEPMPRTTQA